MSASITPYVKLKEVVFMYSEAAKQDDTKFLRLWRMAFRGFQQMGLNGFFPPSRVTVSVNDNNTISFPSNCIKWLWIYPLADSGISEFKKVSNIKNQNEFSVDQSNNYINLHADVSVGQVELECLLAPEQTDDFVIPIEYQEAMLSYIAWQDIAHLPSTSHINNNDKGMRARAYRAQLALAKRMHKPILPEEIRNYRKQFF